MEMDATLSSENDEARIFVGADRSQLLAVKVLEYSIRRRTDLKITLRSMHDLDLPDPKDIRQAKRTGFSFTRFAIPRLAGYAGRALYLDADMLVLRDLRELYALPFGDAKVLIQAPPDAQRANPKRARQCSVMLLDCDALRWDAETIIAGLDGEYTYEELMQQLCILPPHEIGETIPFEWNSLETYTPGHTGLIHYTDMPTQPWVHASNRNGWLWVNEVRDMLAAGALSEDEIEEEVRLGYFRPSLLDELAQRHDEGLPSAADLARFRARDVGFVAHAEVTEQQRRQTAMPRWSQRALAALTRRLHGT